MTYLLMIHGHREKRESQPPESWPEAIAEPVELWPVRHESAAGQ